MISSDLVAIARCPDCRGRLQDGPDEVRCRDCARTFPRDSGYLDLRPLEVFAERTRYVEESLHTDARHETVSPPLLGAGIRNDMLRAFLRAGPGDRLIDLGCGSGRSLVWGLARGAYQVGIDVSPFFADEARANVDLALGDLRRLPFGDGVFTKACALDVMEHLSRDALAEVLAEAARVIGPGGTLFVYSHVLKNSRLAAGLRVINRLAGRLERAGLIDLAQERLRKSDHLNPLRDIPDFERLAGQAGFRLARIRYYTPIVGGFVENVLMKMAERALARRAARAGAPRVPAPDPMQPGRPPGAAAPTDGIRAARADAKRRIARRGPTYFTLRVLTELMKLDLVLFGRVRSGPFFALLEKRR
jgi:SAM-dependent methyltransferase